MRIITLGFPMPSAEVDNHSIANAPALYEYDACLIDPRAVSLQIEGIAAGSADLRKPDGTPVRAGATGAFHFGLGELLTLRRDEMARLLGKGGVVVVIGYPNVPHPVVSTLPGANRYSILPAPDGVIYTPPQFLPADGSSVTLVDRNHAFSGYLQDFRTRITYRARWDTTRIENFDKVGRVFARGAAGVGIGVEFRVGPGQVIFLPPPTQDLRGMQRRPMTEAIVDGIGRAFDAPPPETMPGWVRRFDLPGVKEAETRLKEAEGSFAEAESRLVEARAFHAEAQKFRGLLWGEGHYTFEPLVHEAMQTLGFEVRDGAGGGRVLLHEGDGDPPKQTALLEIDFADGTVTERSYLRLQRRIEEEFLRKGERRKGVIVVNGERLTAPSERKQPYSDLLGNACANFGYALLTGDTLFTLVTYALEDSGLEDPDAETLAAIREIILDSDGPVSVEELDEDEDLDEDAVDEDGGGEDDEGAEAEAGATAGPEEAGEASEPPASADGATPARAAVTADSEGGG